MTHLGSHVGGGAVEEPEGGAKGENRRARLRTKDLAAAATESGLVGQAFRKHALDRQRAARSGAVERGVAAIWVGSAEALAYRTSKSRSYERPAITEGG